jgi:hypothetical protein
MLSSTLGRTTSKTCGSTVIALTKPWTISTSNCLAFLFGNGRKLAVQSRPEWNEEYNCPQEQIDEIDQTLWKMVMDGLLDMGIDESGLTFVLTPKGRAYAEGM